MATSTRAQVVAYLVRHYALGWIGHNTGTSQTALTDDYVFGGHGGRKDIQVGDEVRMMNGDQAGDQSRLATIPALTTGTTTLDPGLGAATGAAVSTLGAELTATQTSLTVASATPFPTVAPFVATIDTSGNASGPERVLVTDVNSTTWTIVRNYANTANSGTHASGEEIGLDDEFHILRSPLRFYDIFAAITHAGKTFEFEKRIVPITMMRDGDMLQADTLDTDSWLASNATITKIASRYELPLRRLRVSASASAGRAGGSIMATVPGDTYFVEATGLRQYAASAGLDHTGTLVVRDQVNSTDLTLDESVITKQQRPQLLTTPALLMPDDASNCIIRLVSDDNGDNMEWANVIFRPNNATQFVLQDRPQRVQRVGRVFATTTAKWDERGDWDRHEIARDTEQVGSGLWQINLRQSVAGMSVWYEEFIQAAEMFSDADTTTVPIEELAAVAAEQLLKPFEVRSEEWALRYKKAAIDAAAVRRRYHEGVHKMQSKPQTVYPLPPV